MRWRNALLGVTAGAVFSAATSTGAAPLTLPIDTTVSPIQHVVIIDQENHSFDNVIGKFCSEAAAGSIARQPCDGATVGYAGTSEIPLATSPDVVSTADHSIVGQQQGINGGLMNGFFRNRECRPTGTPPYKCYQQYDPSQIPNLAALATSFAVSDRTFEFRTSPSWAGHMVLASATLDGFEGDNPKMVIPGFTVGPGWGCDSNKEEQWSDGTTSTLVPTCIPDANGNGPVVASPVAYVPTIFDSMDAASEAWKLYAGAGSDGYRWNICPTFYECLGGTQRQNWVPAANVLTDATAGNLPALSIVTPRKSTSQHNGFSMAIGDNWIGSVVSAIENGPDWMTTAIFITYDDCGCFYDHVNPLQFNTDWGIRVPMVIVSPYAKAGYTDSTPTTFMGLLAYTEHLFGLTPLVPDADGAAYDFSNSFDYTQVPRTGVPMVKTVVPPAELRFIRAHAPKDGDPT
jgi:phospholipase C